MPSTWKEGSNDGNSRQEQLHQHNCAHSAAETFSCASSTKHPSQMLNHDSADKPAASTSSGTSSTITSPSSIPKKFYLMRLTLFNRSGTSRCCAGWQRGYLLCLQLDFKPRLGWLVPFGGEVLCPAVHTQHWPFGREQFADRTSSTTRHFQYMTSDHIKLALSSTENSSGFSFWCQRGERGFDDFMNSDVAGEKKKEIVQLTLKCLCVEILSYKLTSNVSRNYDRI